MFEREREKAVVGGDVEKPMTSRVQDERLSRAESENSHRSDQVLLTVEEVAEILRVPLSWVYERTRQRSIGRIPGFRLGKYWRFRESDLLAWIERQRVGARPNA